VAEERNAAVLELRILLLESESESVVGGSETVYSHRRRRQRRAKRDAFARCTPPLYPYWLVYATAAYPRRRPRGAPLSNWAHCSALRDALAGDYATFFPPSLPSAGGCSGAFLYYTIQIPCSSLFSVVFSTLPLVASPSFDSAFLQLAAFLCSFT
jgi:hypothetical protein